MHEIDLANKISFNLGYKKTDKAFLAANGNTSKLQIMEIVI